MSQLRRIQRNLRKVQPEEEVETVVVPDNHRDLPEGLLLSEPIKGDYLTLPLFGQIALRAGDRVPLVLLTLMLMSEQMVQCGTLRVTLPVIPKTEIPTLAALERYGWDGRVWPTDGGWPSGSGIDEDNLRSLMAQANLRSTLVFPPNDSGMALQSVTVSRARGPFLMPPLPEHTGTVDPDRLERFRQLCADPSTMHLSVPHS